MIHNNPEKNWVFTFYIRNNKTAQISLEGYKKSEAREHLLAFKNAGFHKTRDDGSIIAVPSASIDYIIME